MEKRLTKWLSTLLVLMLILTGCSNGSTEKEGESTFKPGTYTSTVRGMADGLEVEVEFSAEKIESVKIVSHNETDGIADGALENVPSDIVEFQTLAVDGIAGATYTSDAIIAAVKDCIEQAGGNPDDFMTPVTKDEGDKTEVTIETDVLIIGGGIAGLSAALSAAEQGVDVVLVDKMPKVGGTTAISGGYLICVESETFADSDVDDSLDSMLDYWHEAMAYTKSDSGYPDYDRLEDVLGDTGQTVDFLVSQGVKFNEELFFGFGIPAAVAEGGGAGLISQMETAAIEAGVQVMTNTKATELVLNNNAVVGAMAESEDSIIEFKATSVILASGGISGNEELVLKYSPQLEQVIPTSAVSSTGDGLLMALDAGAAIFDDFFTAIRGSQVDPEFLAINPDASKLTTPAQLGINSKGERFGSEQPKYADSLGSDMIQDANYPYTFIYDSSNEELNDILESGVEGGVVVKAETIEELAAGLNIDAATLVKTYDDYQAMVENKEDTQFSKDESLLVSLDKAPYYGVTFYPTTFGSTGGVLTDANGRVLDNSGNVITGLYAAGEMSNRYFYNQNYILTASLGLYSTTGYRAGVSAANDIK